MLDDVRAELQRALRATREDVSRPRAFEEESCV
jgi:hypothetical protein